MTCWERPALMKLEMLICYSSVIFQFGYKIFQKYAKWKKGHLLCMKKMMKLSHSAAFVIVLYNPANHSLSLPPLHSVWRENAGAYPSCLGVKVKLLPWDTQTQTTIHSDAIRLASWNDFQQYCKYTGLFTTQVSCKEAENAASWAIISLDWKSANWADTND